MKISEQEIQEHAETMGYEPCVTNDPNYDADSMNEILEQAEQDLMAGYVAVFAENHKEVIGEECNQEVLDLLMKGNGDQEASDAVMVDDEVYMYDWAISQKDGQWYFEHQSLHGEEYNFWDVDLLRGLWKCEEIQPQARLADYFNRNGFTEEQRNELAEILDSIQEERG